VGAAYDQVKLDLNSVTPTNPILARGAAAAA